MIERERESRKEKANISSTISWGFTDRNSTGRELKLLYEMRAMHGYWNHKISPRSKVSGFQGNREKGGIPGNHTN